MKTTKTKWIPIGAAVLLAGFAVLRLDAGQLEPAGAVAPTMRDAGQLGALGEATSLRVFDDQLGGAADLRSEAYIRINVDGTPLDGDVTGGQYDQWSRVIGADYRFVRSFDPVTFALTGARDHYPLVVRMNLEKNWPLIYKAVTDNEALDEAILEWVRPDLAAPYYRIVLTNGRITRAETKLVPTPAGQAHILEVEFVFGSIDWEWVPDGTLFGDSWSGV